MMNTDSKTALTGHCIEVGDDDQGQPRLIIHTTRAQLMAFAGNLAFQDVEVRLAPKPAPVPIGDNSCNSRQRPEMKP